MSYYILEGYYNIDHSYDHSFKTIITPENSAYNYMVGNSWLNLPFTVYIKCTISGGDNEIVELENISLNEISEDKYKILSSYLPEDLEFY